MIATWIGDPSPPQDSLVTWRSKAPGGRPRILIVEDDADIAEMYRRQLMLSEMEVEVAGTAGAGIAAIGKQTPDAVLLDMRLPDQDGFAVLEAVRADPNLESLPVLVLSNYGEAPTIQRAMALGARDYLVKAHVTPRQVVARLQEHLSGGSDLSD